MSSDPTDTSDMVSASGAATAAAITSMVIIFVCFIPFLFTCRRHKKSKDANTLRGLEHIHGCDSWCYYIWDEYWLSVSEAIDALVDLCTCRSSSSNQVSPLDTESNHVVVPIQAFAQDEDEKKRQEAEAARREEILKRREAEQKAEIEQRRLAFLESERKITELAELEKQKEQAAAIKIQALQRGKKIKQNKINLTFFSSLTFSKLFLFLYSYYIFYFSIYWFLSIPLFIYDTIMTYIYRPSCS